MRTAHDMTDTADHGGTLRKIAVEDINQNYSHLGGKI